MCGKTKANIMYFGTEGGADVMASDIKMNIDGINFKISYKKESERIRLNVVGRHQIYSALAGVCCGIIFGMSLTEIAKNIENWEATIATIPRVSVLKRFESVV